MRISKKILAIALSILMAVSMMPFTVFADDVSFTKVTDASQITAENIGTSTNEDVKSWVLDNWDDVHDDDHFSRIVWINTGELYYVSVETYMSESYFSAAFDNFVYWGVQISDIQQLFGYGDNVYLCTPAAPAATGVANGAELKAAIAAAQDGDVIEFTADVTTYPATSGALVIPVDGKDITLDLKGHTQYFRVSGETTVSYPTDLFVLMNGAKLTVKDSVGGGAIYATYGANSSAYIFNVLDSSELEINGGQFVMDKANRGGVIVYQNSADAKTTINDGTFATVINPNATRNYRNYIVNDTRGEVEINGGAFFTAQTLDYVISEGNTTDTKLTINDGEFHGTMSLDVSKADTELNGGTYLDNAGEANTAVSAYLPADQIIDSTSGEIKAVSVDSVARTNSAEFTSLKDALDSVAAGATETIILLADCTLPATYEITNSQKITIDLNGNDITTTARAFNIRHGQLTIKGNGNLNANFTGANAAVAVYGAATDSGSNYSTFTLTSPATINAPNGYGAMIGATSGAAYGAKLQLGGTINSKYGVYINGNVAEPAVKTNAAAINITGTVTASNENAVVYAAGYAKWNIYSNANLTGGSGVYIKSGAMNIYGNAVITATGEKTDYKFNTNGADATGDAIIIDSCGYPGNIPTVTIKAGTITSANGAAVASYTKQDDPLYPTADFPRVDDVVPGTSTAVFSSDVTDLAADGYSTSYDSTKGGYVVGIQEDGFNLTVEDEIHMNLYVNVEAYADPAAATMTVTYNDPTKNDGTTVTDTYEGADLAALKDDADGRYVVSILAAPAQITDEVTVTVGNHSFTTSVKDYCDAIVDTSNDAELVALAEAMLDYGKAANAEFDYTNATNFDEYINTDNVTDALNAAASCSVSGASGVFTNYSYIATSVPTLRIYVSATEADCVAQGLKATVNGTEVDPTVVEGTDKVCIDITDIMAEDFATVQTVVFNGATIQINALQYAKAKGGDFGRSMYNYYVAANAYFN